MRYGAARHPQTPGLFHSYLRTTLRLDAKTTLAVGPVRFRRYSADEAKALESRLRARTVFSRHSGERDMYASRATAFSDATVVDLFLPRPHDLIADDVRLLADRAERIAFLITAYSMTRPSLHAWLGITRHRRESVDLLIEATFKHVSTQKRRERPPSGLPITSAIVTRAKRFGISLLGDTMVRGGTYTLDRINEALAWLEESRQDPYADAAVVKTTIGFETLFSFDKSEPLRSAVAERVALLVGEGGAQRQQIARLFRHFYDERSAIVHGGSRARSSVLDFGDRLLLLAALALASLAPNLPTRDALRDWFEALRWGTTANLPRRPFGQTEVTRLVKRLV